jgi:hypothetical protein
MHTSGTQREKKVVHKQILFVDVVINVVRGSGLFETIRDCVILVTPRKAVGQDLVPISPSPHIMADLEFKPVWVASLERSRKRVGEMKPHVCDII